MCKTQALVYTCNHTYTTRLSTCHGSFTVRPKANKPLKAACCSAPTLVFKSCEVCGDCQRKAGERALDDALEQRQSQIGWTEAQKEYQTELYKLWKRVPSLRQYRGFKRPGSGGATGEVGVKGQGRRESLLRREVLPEEVLVKWEEKKTVGGAWDQESWGEGWLTLDEELAAEALELGEETMATPSNLPMTGSMNESMDEYMSAFEDDSEGSPDEEDRSCDQWSKPWFSEPADAEGQEWTSEEATYWSSAPEEAEKVDEEKAEREPQQPQEVSSAPSTQDPLTIVRVIDIAVDDHRESAYGSVPIFSPPLEQAPNGGHSRCDSTKLQHQHQQQQQQQQSTLRPQRRSTFDSGGAKTEIELRERLRCLFMLPFLVIDSLRPVTLRSRVRNTAKT